MAKEYIVQKFDGGMHYIIPDKKTVQQLTSPENKRVLCRLNDQAVFHGAITTSKKGEHFIRIGSALCKQLKIKAGSTVKAVFSADPSPYQFAMPEELKEVLDSDPEAGRIFHALTKGNQRGLMHLVAQVKSVDKKIERALKIAQKLKRGINSPRFMLKK